MVLFDQRLFLIVAGNGGYHGVIVSRGISYEFALAHCGSFHIQYSVDAHKCG